MFSPAVGQSSQMVGEKLTEKPAAQEEQQSSENRQPNGRPIIPKTAGADQIDDGQQQTPILNRRQSKLLDTNEDQNNGGTSVSREPSVTFSTVCQK